jgi:hypothetical protein
LRKCIPAPCSWCGFINFAEQRVVPAEREQERSEGTINPRRIQLSTLLFIHSQMRNSFMFFFNHVIIHDHDQITICTQNRAVVVYTYTPQHRQRMGSMSYSQLGIDEIDLDSQFPKPRATRWESDLLHHDPVLLAVGELQRDGGANHAEPHVVAVVFHLLLLAILGIQ